MNCLTVIKRMSCVSILFATSVLCALITSSYTHAQQAMVNPGLLAQSGKRVDPNYQISFPKDHYQHPAYDIEWWYLTANLQDEADNEYALQFTMFRFRSGQAPNGWDDGQSYMGHASVHSEQAHWFSEKFAKGGVGNAGVLAQPFGISFDNWKWQTPTLSTGNMFPATLHFDAAATTQGSSKVEVSLKLNSTADFVLHGDNGYSIKSANQQHASYYYSQPFIEVSGELDFDDSPVKVSGQAWFDHEWTSQLIDQQTTGWDWFSIHLDNGDKLMAFVMRLSGQEDYTTGTLISASGETQTFLPSQISVRPTKTQAINDKQVPTHWQISIPSKSMDINTAVSKKDQFNPARFSYYEGSISVTGTHTGKGFMELTGY